MMKSGRYSTTSMFGAMLCLFCMVGFVTTTSIHTVAHNSTHDHGLRSSSSKTESLGDSDNVLLSELKEIVLILSQKIDDSDARIQSLEEKIRAQELAINTLQNEADNGSSVHRYLQNQECLPTFLQTSFGPRCVFNHVTRFENFTFFNEDVVFNENVEFDNDANCMPTFNSTTQMCRINNNYTFDEGEIIFDYNVRFDEDVRFNDDVRFRDTVLLESDVKFEDGGEVTFDKDTKFHQNVVISNEDHDIEFTIEEKVTTKINGDELKVDTHTTFYDDVTIKKDLDVEGKLKVEKLAELDDLELYGYLWVDKETWLDGALEASHHATIKNGLTVATGGMEVSSHGFQVHGPTTLTGTFDLKGDSHIDGKVRVDGRIIAETMKIDNTKQDRILQNMPNEPPLPALEVFGGADVTGEFFADVIRTDDFEELAGDVEEIARQVVNSLTNDNLIVRDVSVRSGGKSEKVLTESRLVNFMENMALTVQSITANTATINGESIPVTRQSSCECSDSDIEAVVTATVNKNYVKKFGFVTDNALAAMDLSGDCTCTAAEVEDVVNEGYLVDLGVSFAPAECSCEQDVVKAAITPKFLEKRLTAIGVPLTENNDCTCSEGEIQEAVSFDFVQSLGFSGSP